MNNPSLLKLSAIQLADKIKTGDISSETATEFYINQQKNLNPKINAITEDNWDQALSSAKQKDKFRVTKNPSELPKFFGVPFTVKEMWAIEGFKNTLGSVHLKHHRAQFTSTVVKKILDSGAVLTATTNVPELGFWFECENPVYGETRNPYDPTRTSGGSSGGEAALIGAGASPFGLGTDVGGSIRLPAGFCGIFGHKPSNQWVSLLGHSPMTPLTAKNMGGDRYPLTVGGPLARVARDLRPLLETIMGPDQIDPEVRIQDFKPAPQDWSKITVWTIEEPVISLATRTDSSVRSAVEMSAQYFESMGAKVKKMNPNTFFDAFALWSMAMKEVQGRNFEDYLFEGAEINLAQEILKSLTGNGNYTIPALGTVILERLKKKNIEIDKSLDARALHLLRNRFNKLMGQDSILIMPLHPRVAPKLKGTYLRPFDFSYTGIFNALKVPASAGPVFFENNLPVSVQIVAGQDQDHLTLAAIEQIENAFGGWQQTSTKL